MATLCSPSAYPEENNPYGFNLNSNYKSYNGFIGIYLYDSFGIKTPKIPLIIGIQNCYLSPKINFPIYPLYVVNVLIFLESKASFPNPDKD